VALLLSALPLSAQLGPSGLDGGGGLGGQGGLNNGGQGGLQKCGQGGLHSSKGLQSGNGGLRTENQGLQTSRVEAAGRLSTAKLKPVQVEAGRGLVSPAALKRTAEDITRNGLSDAKLRGAATAIPPSQIGALLFDVACELEQMENMTEVAVGYYMAVLADPKGSQCVDARARLHEIFLDEELTHDGAVELYDAGLATLDGLVELKIGLTPDGLAAGRRDLVELKKAYRERRAREATESGREDVVQKAAQPPAEVEIQIE